MFASKIVFVVGAGAGAEISMPVGRSLASMIADKMDIEWDSIGHLVPSRGDRALFLQVSNGVDYKEWTNIAARLKAGLPLSKSIDDFLDFHQDDKKMVKLGKAAIVKSILESERGSKIFYEQKHVDDTIDFSAISDTWLVKFMHMLGQGNVEAVFENVAFVNFNYDRCLEHFLINAVKALYGLRSEKAAALVKSAKIYHPYGYIGALPDMGGATPYGHATGNPIHLAEHIRTYTEELGEGTRFDEVRKTINDAKVIVFLGFAFHRQNMKLLSLSPSLRAKKVYATALGISGPDASIITSRILNLFAPDERNFVRSYMHLQTGVACSGLFDTYMLTLPEA